ncbi:MAG: aminodeoxyfutalosine deaminase [Gaiellaceae bacterium]|nr:aminodeoxyfutalosine deaminase [Gaiellaceae bacterium]
MLSADWVLPVEGEPIRDGAIAFEDGRIVAVGRSADLGAGTRYEGAAIVPGLVNAHTHLEYAVYAGFGDGLPFEEWLATHIERKQLLRADDHEAIARLGAAECLGSGVTTIGDASFTGAAAAAAHELGLRATLYLEVFGDDPEPALARFARLRDEVGPHLSERVRLGVSPHAPYTTGIDVYAAVAELGLPLMSHLAETAAEREWLEQGAGPWQRSLGDKLLGPTGSTGIRALAERGLLSPRLAAVHCVDLQPDELALLAGSGSGVVHCPRSNSYLGCGIAPLRALLDAGARVGLGTDSPNSAVDFDLFAELRAAVMHARAREHAAESLSATEALELATLGGARALGLDGEIGSLVPGKRADLAVVALADTGLHPWEDPATAVVLGGSPEHVQATLVGGEIRYEKGNGEWQRHRSAAVDARRRMLASASAAPPGSATSR